MAPDRLDVDRPLIPGHPPEEDDPGEVEHVVRLVARAGGAPNDVDHGRATHHQGQSGNDR